VLRKFFAAHLSANSGKASGKILARGPRNGEASFCQLSGNPNVDVRSYLKFKFKWHRVHKIWGANVMIAIWAISTSHLALILAIFLKTLVNVIFCTQIVVVQVKIDTFALNVYKNITLTASGEDMYDLDFVCGTWVTNIKAVPLVWAEPVVNFGPWIFFFALNSPIF
jgi:hypothetical protein